MITLHDDTTTTIYGYDAKRRRRERALRLFERLQKHPAAFSIKEKDGIRSLVIRTPWRYHILVVSERGNERVH